jgi:hypothetical protein
MAKVAVAFIAAICVFAIQGCNVGTITPEQQKAKKDFLQKQADDHPDPNREKRPG